jgi:ER lumen protein retaining receptor
MRCFGFGLLNYKAWTAKTAAGISVKTLELYVITFIVRLYSITRHQGYLPFDKTGDWFYHVIEIVSLLCVGLLLYGILGPLISTYAEKHDRFGNLHIPSEFGAVYLLAPCIVLAILFHP